MKKISEKTKWLFNPYKIYSIYARTASYLQAKRGAQLCLKALLAYDATTLSCDSLDRSIPMVIKPNDVWGCRDGLQKIAM